MKNNKGLGRAFGIILIFGIITFLFAFSFFLIKETSDDLIFDETYNVTKEVVQDLNVSIQMQNHIDDIKTEYDSINWPIDLLFLVMFIGAFIITVKISVTSAKLPIYSFYGIVTFGTMLFLFMLSFIEQAREYLFNNFYYNVFDFANVSTPIMDYFITNMAWICFVWFLAIVLANQYEKLALLFNTEEGGFKE